jgi:hypothetical protein
MTYDELANYTFVCILAAALAVALVFILVRKLCPAYQPKPAPDDDDLIYYDPMPETPVVLVRTRAPLDDERTRLTALEWTPDVASRQMVEDAIDWFIADAILGTTREDATPEQRAFAAGSLDTIYRFSRHLRALEEERTEPRRLSRQ